MLVERLVPILAAVVDGGFAAHVGVQKGTCPARAPMTWFTSTEQLG
jgi:hypothetical protein